MDYRRVLLAAAVAATAANADDYFTGDGTAYTLGSLSSGNCNMMMSGYSSASTNYAAINSEQWNSLANCGRCAEVSCDDSKCSDTTTSVVVQILDQCPECKYGDLDLSPSVFKTITGSDPARYSIKWKFVDCPISGNVNYCLKSGSNAYWTAVQPANFVTGVASMTINGAATTMLGSAYYYLLDGASTKQTDLSAVTISVTDVNGQTITDTVSLSDSSCTAGSSQFSSSGSSGTTTYTQPKSSTPTPTTAAPTSAPVTTTSAPAPTTAAPTPAPSPSTAAPTSAPTPTTAAPTSAPATTAPPTYSDESVSPATTAPAYTPAPETISPDLSVSTSTPVPVTPAPESTYNFDSIDQSDASDSEADSKADASGNASSNGTSTYTTRTPTSTTKAPSTGSVSEDADSQKENTEAPTPTPTSEAQKQPTSSSSGGAQEANTQSGGGSGSSAVIGSIAAAACAVIVAAVAVVVIQKKKKAMEERKAGEEDAELASSHLRMRSFDLQRMSTPANQQNVAMMQNEPHRSDLAIL